MLRAVVGSPLNVLLIAAPLSWMVRALAPTSPWLFLLAALSLVPLAGLIGLGTEHLARRAGPAWGGFLNATFGNAAETMAHLGWLLRMAHNVAIDLLRSQRAKPTEEVFGPDERIDEDAPSRARALRETADVDEVIRLLRPAADQGEDLP